MQNSKFNFKLHAEGQNAILSEGKIPDINDYTNTTTLSYKVIHDYYYADKSTATNNGVAYYLDEEHLLMSDIDGNVRYYGASPNNYVSFNCDTYPDTNCELWRIIGVFNGKIKLVRASKLSSMSWDQDKNENPDLLTYSNNWANASLQKFLNGLYYNHGETTTLSYYSRQDGSYTSTLNLSSIGIKESTRNLIADSTWYLGGYTTPKIYVNKMYEYEKSSTKGTNIYGNNPTSFTAKIGLMHPSDYGYSTDLSKCNELLRNYDNSNNSYACRTNSWLFVGRNEWLISPNPSNDYHGWYITTAGYINYSTYVFSPYDVRPTLYLNPDITLVSGTGTSSDPYKIS